MCRTLAALLLSVGFAWAADSPVEAQKTAARENLKKAGADKFAAAETADLLVFATLPESKPKLIAESAQKSLALARTSLKFEAKDELWPGKLTLYVLTSRQQFTAFARQVEQRQPDKQAWFGLNHRSEPPYAVVTEEPGEKSSDAEQQADAAAVVAAAVLNRKAAATPSNPLPEWLQIGYGRAVHARASGGAKLAEFRKQTRAAVIGTKAKPGASLQDVWDGTKRADTEWVHASLAEYLAFGPVADKFPAFLGGFKAGENVNAAPTVWDALTAADWKGEQLETGWKRWAAAGK